MKVGEESMYLREVLNSKMVVLNKRRQNICMCLKLDDNKAENKMPHIFFGLINSLPVLECCPQSCLLNLKDTFAELG